MNWYLFVFPVLLIKGSLDYSYLGNLIIWKACTMEVTFGKIRAETVTEKVYYYNIGTRVTGIETETMLMFIFFSSRPVCLFATHNEFFLFPFS